MNRIRKILNILKHDEKIQNAIMAFCCFAIIGIAALYRWLFG